jgi:hypothetical protein
MGKPRIPAIVTAGVYLLLLAVAAQAADKSDKKQVIQRARASYYSLKANGLVEFQCNLAPDWSAVLQEQLKTDPTAANRAIQILGQLRFTVTVGTSGQAKITHTTITPTNAEMAKGLDQIYGGMEQMVSGFFDTWSPFMVTSPFPEADSVYQLDEQPNQWSLSYKEGPADVATSMTKDLAISALKVTTADFNSTLRPQFSPNSKGFLLAGYQAEYYGKSPAETTKLNVRIGYQEVSGLQLPRTLGLDGSYGGSPFQIAVTFSACKAATR